MEDDRRHRLAVVDCGTNTFTLHIARFDEGGWKSVFRQRRFVRLGHDSFRTGRLSPLRMRRGLDVLSSFRETALNFGVTHVRAIGCSALRDAANGAEFVRRAGEQGWAIEVIDGGQEAAWIQRGVADTVPQDVLGTDAALTLTSEAAVWRPCSGPAGRPRSVQPRPRGGAADGLDQAIRPAQAQGPRLPGSHHRPGQRPPCRGVQWASTPVARRHQWCIQFAGRHGDGCGQLAPARGGRRVALQHAALPVPCPDVHEQGGIGGHPGIAPRSHSLHVHRLRVD